MTFSRRTFLIKNLAAASVIGTLTATGNAYAQAAVSEADPQAQALGYKTEGSKVDIKKHPNYAASQSCSGCALFQGKTSDSSASCAVFGDKLVAGKGWCGAWTKRS